MFPFCTTLLIKKFFLTSCEPPSLQLVPVSPYFTICCYLAFGFIIFLTPFQVVVVCCQPTLSLLLAGEEIFPSPQSALSQCTSWTKRPKTVVVLQPHSTEQRWIIISLYLLTMLFLIEPSIEFVWLTMSIYLTWCPLWLPGLILAHIGAGLFNWRCRTLNFSLLRIMWLLLVQLSRFLMVHLLSDTHWP